MDIQNTLVPLKSGVPFSTLRINVRGWRKARPIIVDVVGIGIEEVRARIPRDFLYLSVNMRTFFSSESIEIGRKSRGLVVISQLIGLGSVFHPDFFRLLA
jgi:hypothetical protein